LLEANIFLEAKRSTDLLLQQKETELRRKFEQDLFNKETEWRKQTEALRSNLVQELEIKARRLEDDQRRSYQLKELEMKTKYESDLAVEYL
jgi:hypothetical protein